MNAIVHETNMRTSRLTDGQQWTISQSIMNNDIDINTEQQWQIDRPIDLHAVGPAMHRGI